MGDDSFNPFTAETYVKQVSFWKPLLFGLCLGIIAGCAMIGHEKVEGWPALEIVEHHVAHNVMRDRCAKYVGPGAFPEACAEFDFAAALCDIWFSADFPPSQSIIEHERLHCRGYDHIGSSAMKAML